MTRELWPDEEPDVPRPEFRIVPLADVTSRDGVQLSFFKNIPVDGAGQEQPVILRQGPADQKRPSVVIPIGIIRDLGGGNLEEGFENIVLVAKGISWANAGHYGAPNPLFAHYIIPFYGSEEALQERCRQFETGQVGAETTVYDSLIPEIENPWAEFGRISGGASDQSPDL